MKTSLVFPLIKGTIWELIEEPKKKKTIPLYKSTALFCKVKPTKTEGMKLLKKNKMNTIALTLNAVNRYISLGYVVEWGKDE